MTVIPGEVIIESKYTNRILSSAAFALLYYDFVLTIPQEVERYMSVLSHIPVIFEFFGVLPEQVIYLALKMSVNQRCREFQQYHRIISIVIQGVVAAVLVLRTYALYGRDRRIFALLLSIASVGAVISIWVVIIGHNTRRPTATYAEDIARTGCDLTLSQAEGYDLAIAWSSILVFDAAVFILTLLQAFKIGRAWSGGFLRVMLRDAKPVHKGVSTSITNVVSTTLATRLMLNIRDPDLMNRPRRWGQNETDSF
ncbi:hypothetical protein BV20DRAFT_1035559 [Pilatotrama ljubarskyi]|nr:hypothetical protein BV20DRAFT_1035559 [Pilatotrama ljubarskyi]